MKKKGERKKPTEEEESHPWLLTYNKKDHPGQKLDILKETLMNLEDNVGFISIVLIINTVFIVALTFGALITGVVGISGAVSDQLISLVKSAVHK